MTQTDGSKFLTIAGTLIFTKNPERFLPQAGITAVRFKGVDLSYEALDREDVEGALVNSYDDEGKIIEYGVIEKAIRFVERNTSTFSYMDGIVRKDVPQYLKESVREAIVNAIAHRHYSIIGSKIRLFVFNNRLEVRSPGKIPNTVTIEQMKTSCHYARNPVIVKFLQHFGYVEDIGLGIPNKIIRLMKEHAGKEPELKELGEEFMVTLFPAEAKEKYGEGVKMTLPS
jgi:ATP-dependent DNA helicase RecG